MCEQVALYAVRRTEGAIEEASVTIPAAEMPWSAIEAIDPAQLPNRGGNLQINDVDHAPDRTTISLAASQSVGDVLGTIRSRLSQTERRS
jgi:hypothetical protein